MITTPNPNLQCSLGYINLFCQIQYIDLILYILLSKSYLESGQMTYFLSLSLTDKYKLPLNHIDRSLSPIDSYYPYGNILYTGRSCGLCESDVFIKIHNSTI